MDPRLSWGHVHLTGAPQPRPRRLTAARALLRDIFVTGLQLGAYLLVVGCAAAICVLTALVTGVRP